MSEAGKLVTHPTETVLTELDWPAVENQLDGSGFAMSAPLLSPERCAEVVDMVDDDVLFRKTVIMAPHLYGEGSYRYFVDPLPPLVRTLRESLYPPLAAIANRWADRLGERRFPETFDALLDECAMASSSTTPPNRSPHSAGSAG